MASYERIPYLILFQESAGYKDTYAGISIFVARRLLKQNQIGNALITGHARYSALPSTLI